MSADAAGDEPAIRIPLLVPDEQGRSLQKLVSPLGWPRLPPLEPGEKLAAYLERALLADSFYLKVCRYSGEPRLRIAPFRPAQMTLSQWHERWPDRPIRRGYGDPTARPNYYPDLVLARLLVALCDQLLAGEVELRGFRFSTLAEERVPLGLLRSDAVLLDPNIDDGRLRRLPEGLPVYRELTLRPATDAATEAVASQSVPTGEAAPPSSPPASTVLAAQVPHPRRDYTEPDVRLVAEMHRLLTRVRKQDRAKNVTDAARLVVKAAQGEGTEDSKVRRLVARYRQIHPKGAAD